MASVASWLAISNATPHAWLLPREWLDLWPFATLFLVSGALLCAVLGMRRRTARGSFAAQVVLFACTAVLAAACVSLLVRSASNLKPRQFQQVFSFNVEVPF